MFVFLYLLKTNLPPVSYAKQVKIKTLEPDNIIHQWSSHANRKMAKHLKTELW